MSGRRSSVHALFHATTKLIASANASALQSRFTQTQGNNENVLCNTRDKLLTLITRSDNLSLFTKLFWSASGHSAHCWTCRPVYRDIDSLIVKVSKLIHLRPVPTTDSTTGSLSRGNQQKLSSHLRRAQTSNSLSRDQIFKRQLHEILWS